ncbi:MAG TPA: S41 family peptidase [Acidobacteriaceae bacterium]|nr:S41 family peptidase [Acidobacteriaceae bacterium]
MTRVALLCAPALLLLSAFAAPIGQPQSLNPPILNSESQYRLHQILRDAHDEVKKHYFDPKFHGIDWEARFREADARVAQAHTMGDGFTIVAALLGELKDSHTYFTPPERSSRSDLGYRLGLLGDACFVTQVRPKTDAAEKVHVGDQVVHLDGYDVNRADLEDVNYFFRLLAPPAAVQLDLRSPSGEVRRVVVRAAVQEGKSRLDLTQGTDINDLIRRDEDEDYASRSRMVEIGDAVIWRMSNFDEDYGPIDRGMNIVRKHKMLILDLRGNPGGSTQTLAWMVGSMFDHDVKIADRVGRNEKKPMIARRYGSTFTGKLIVLIDGGSASAAELFARTIQIEHRGIVIGDQSAGAVMEARWYGDSEGADTRIFYGFSVTDADLIMTDGKSLEKTGVTPDELMLPTAEDLAAGRDPVLSRAAALAGVQLDPVAAGRLFPFEWMQL